MQNGKSNSIEKNKTRHNSWDNWLLEGARVDLRVMERLSANPVLPTFVPW